MSRAAILYFTDQGAQLGGMLSEKLDCTAQKPPKGGLAALTEKLFHEVEVFPIMLLTLKKDIAVSPFHILSF